VSEHRDLPYPEPEDFGLSSRHGLVSVIIFVRHRPGDELRVTVVSSDDVSSLESDRTIVFELRDPHGGVVVDHAAGAVGRLSKERFFELIVRVPPGEPARYVAGLEIHPPAAPPRVFEWPVEVPDPTLPVTAELELSAPFASPGDTLELTVRNTGPNPITFGEDYEVELRREDGGWEDVVDKRFVLRIGHVLEPAESLPLEVVVPRRARPGRHRVAMNVHGWARGTARPTVEFYVVARRSE
jgi:hypothetical protein